MTSLSVLLPTFNSMPLLRAHVESMKPWLDLASEIIVVDSFSTDGSAEFLREALSSHPVAIHNHPRGLYQSWNYGIQQATCRWLYISTVGDSITKEQLLHHLEIGGSLGADVVISRPRWIDEHDRPSLPVRWAVNDIVDLLSLSEPRVLEGSIAHFFAILHTYSSSLLGSVASDLFKTSHLQQRLFPTNYGMSGDGAWGLRYATDTRFVVTPKQGSTFRIHAKPYSLSDYHVNELGEQLYQLARSVHTATPGVCGGLHLQNSETLELTRAATQLYAELKAIRRERRPWFLFPDVWALRVAGKRALKKLKRHTVASAASIRRTFNKEGGC